ncbi:MAG: phospholipase D family protein [Clostridiales bacterium]|nr:phospholipase D family protein [Clostridiales bacterium]
MKPRRSKRSVPARVAGWLLRLFLLYLVLGATVPFAAHPSVSEDYQAAVAETDYTGDAPGVDRVMLLEDSVTALSERFRMISQAEERIILSTFDFRDDNSGTDMIALLWEAAERGVKVQILVDGFSAMSHMGSRTSFVALAAHPNVEIKLYNSLRLWDPSTFNGRLHDKYLIVDDDLYILGGRNTYDFFLGDYPTGRPNYDREVLVWNTGEDVEDSSLQQLLDYFDEVWNLDCCKLYRDNEANLEKKAVQKEIEELENRAHDLRIDYYDSFQEIDYRTCTYAANQITLLSNPTDTGVKEPELLYALTELMKTGEESVILHTPYAVCDQAMYDSLTQVAEAVPSFQMVLNSVANGGNYLASSDYLRSKGKLLDTGVSLWEYNGGESYHGKSVVIDDRISVVGSFNWDMRSAYLDTELMLVIDSEGLNAELRGYMADIQADSLLCLDKTAYGLTGDATVPEVTGAKAVVVRILQFVTWPVRFLL